MKCAECGADNADASRVCGVCNAPLVSLTQKVPDENGLGASPASSPIGEQLVRTPGSKPEDYGHLLYHAPKGIAIRRSDRGGRGVFAERRFAKGETIERCPVIVIPADQLDHIYETTLSNYVYPWIDKVEEAVMVLGFGSIYNHSFSPNADWLQDFTESVQSYVALRDIEQGEEITVNYNGPPDDGSPVWFDVTD